MRRLSDPARDLVRREEAIEEVALSGWDATPVMECISATKLLSPEPLLDEMEPLGELDESGGGATESGGESSGEPAGAASTAGT